MYHSKLFQQNLFDSDLYNGRVYTAILTNTSAAASLEQELSFPTIKTAKRLFVQIPWDHNLICLLQTHNFILTAERVYYQYSNNNTHAYKNISLPPNIKIISGKPPLQNFVFGAYNWEKITITLGQISRYFHDIQKPSLYQKVYHQWCYNTMQGYADHVICLISSGSIVGFTSLKHISDTKVSIDLLGIVPSFQRNGLGEYLLFQALHYATQHNCDLLVDTITHKIPANAFYQKKGFIINSTALIYCKYPT